MFVLQVTLSWHVKSAFVSQLAMAVAMPVANEFLLANSVGQFCWSILFANLLANFDGPFCSPILLHSFPAN